MGDPVVRVLRGAPDETELAALIAVSATKPAEPEVRAPRPRRRLRFRLATSWRR